MKGFVLAVALVLVLPLSAFAHSSCPGCLPYIGNIDTNGGTLTGTNAGLTLTGSFLTGIRGISGADLGTVTITTPALWGGTLQSGGWFGPGGSIIITLDPNVLGGKLSGGGILYNGSFLGGATWTPVLDDPGYYFFGGTAYGVLPNGTYGQAFVYEEFHGSVNSNGMFTGTVVASGADIVPEPGTLGLFATGLIGMGGAIRRKLRM